MRGGGEVRDELQAEALQVGAQVLVGRRAVTALTAAAQVLPESVQRTIFAPAHVPGPSGRWNRTSNQCR